MDVGDKVAVVTGGGDGIGAALAVALADRGARVVIADLDSDAVHAVADRINAAHDGACAGMGADVSDTEAIRRLIGLAETAFGPVDLYFANAGIPGAPSLDADDAEWDRSIDVNLRAHIRAARELVPGWVRRGSGYFVSTASAAGLLTQIGGLTYAVTKHAAVAFAEWLAVTYGDQGVGVSCLCPMGVNTKFLYAGRDAESQSGDALAGAATRAVTAAGEVLEPAVVAEVTLDAIAAERFLILPHPQVLDMYRQKGIDYDRWLNGMRRYQRAVVAAAEDTPEKLT